jgi:hypothetical protein
MERQPRPQDISWFLDLHSRKQLDLNPSYQRRGVWTRRDREYFLDTIFHNYPSPAIFLHRTIDETGKATYHVVDGKQRLETILLFADNKIKIPADFGDDRFNGKRWDELDRDAKQIFWNYSISVEFLPTVDEAVVNTVFERINRNSRKLTRQELRHAKYEGWCIKFLEVQAEHEDWEKLGIVTRARAKRMADVQFLSELLMVTVKNAVLGFDQDAIDQFYADYDNTDELAEAIDTDEVENRFNLVKSFLVALLERAPETKSLIRTFGHFYTLWTYVALSDLRWNIAEDPQNFAPLYLRFMDRVREFTTNPFRRLAPNGPDAALDEAATLYAANATGASTDEGPRVARLNALRAGIRAIQQ